MSYINKLLFNILIILLSHCALVCANDWDPWYFSLSDSTSYVADSIYYRSVVGPWKVLSSGAMLVYQQVISPVNGKHCPMYPSCSQYAKEAVGRHGLFIGLLEAFDRLHRCGHDLRFYEPVYVEGETRFYDYP